MAAPSRRITPKNDTSGSGSGTSTQTLNLSTVNTDYQAGDLVVVQVISADDPPVVTVGLVSAGNATITTEDASRSTTGTTTITLGDGTGGTIPYDDRSASQTAGLFTYTWSFRVEVVHTPSVGVTTQLVTTATWVAAGARRLCVYVDKPGTNCAFLNRAARKLAVAKNTDTNTGANTYWGTEGAFNDTKAMCAHAVWGRSGTTGAVTIDVDGPGSGAGTNDSTMTIILDASGRGFADGFWDAAAANNPATGGATGFILSATPGNTHAFAFVIYMAEAIVSPTNAPVTASGNNASVLVTPFAGNAPSTAVANDAAAVDPTHPHPTSASGTAAANNATVKVSPSPSNAPAVATAYNPIFAIPRATETDAAIDVTAYKLFSTEINFADPTIYEAVIAVHATVSKDDPADAGDIRFTLKQAGVEKETGPWVALTDTPTDRVFTLAGHYDGTGFSMVIETRTTLSVNAIVTGAAPTVSWIAGVASATATANPPVPNVRPMAGNATAAAAGNNASVRDLQPAGNAQAAAAANTVVISIKASAGNAPATATGNDAKVQVSVSATNAAAAATANNATAAQTVNVTAGSASGTATANGPVVNIAANAGNAPSTATANSPTANVAINATSGSATGTANQPVNKVAPNGGFASSAGAANDGRISIIVNAGVDIAVATANDANASTASQVQVFPSSASSAGAGNNATIKVTPFAGNAPATGSASTAAPSVRVNAGAAAATGTGNNATTSTSTITQVNPTAALGSATGNDARIQIKVFPSFAAGVAAGLNGTLLGGDLTPHEPANPFHGVLVVTGVVRGVLMLGTPQQNAAKLITGGIVKGRLVDP